MATGPKVAESPLELLNREVIGEPFFSQIFNPVIGGVMGFVGVTIANWASRRPMLSGIQKHVIGTAVGVYIGQWFDTRRRAYYADKDAMFRHYISLHPEDFPPYKRRQYKDILDSWNPIR